MDMSVKPRPRGKLVAIGGAEDKSATAKILGRVLELASSEKPVVGVITTASSIPDEVFPAYEEAFYALGAAEVLDVRIRERSDAEAA